MSTSAIFIMIMYPTTTEIAEPIRTARPEASFCSHRIEEVRIQSRQHGEHDHRQHREEPRRQLRLGDERLDLALSSRCAA